MNTMLPISLFVTLEVLKFWEAIFVFWDHKMYSIEKDRPALVSSSSLMEELGQINYLFSDKTGTLTRNEMSMQSMAVGNLVFNSNLQQNGTVKFELDKFH